MQVLLSGTVVQFAAVFTKACAFISPNPRRVLNHNPAAFFCHPGLLATGANSDVQTIICWASLQVRFGLKIAILKHEGYDLANGMCILDFQGQRDDSCCQWSRCGCSCMLDGALVEKIRCGLNQNKCYFKYIAYDATYVLWIYKETLLKLSTGDSSGFENITSTPSYPDNLSYPMFP